MFRVKKSICWSIWTCSSCSSHPLSLFTSWPWIMCNIWTNSDLQLQRQRSYSHGTLLSRSYLQGWWFWVSPWFWTPPRLLASIEASVGGAGAAGWDREFKSWSPLESPAGWMKLSWASIPPWAWRSEVMGTSLSGRRGIGTAWEDPNVPLVDKPNWCISEWAVKELKEGGSLILGSDETSHYHIITLVRPLPCLDVNQSVGVLVSSRSKSGRFLFTDWNELVTYWLWAPSGLASENERFFAVSSVRWWKHELSISSLTHCIPHLLLLIVNSIWNRTNKS